MEAHRMASRLRLRVTTPAGVELDPAELDELEQKIIEEEKRDKCLLEASHFRNITFDRWLRVFITVRIYLYIFTYIYIY